MYKRQQEQFSKPKEYEQAVQTFEQKSEEYARKVEELNRKKEEGSCLLYTSGKVIKMTIVKVSNSKIVFYYEVIYKLSIGRYTYFTYSFMKARMWTAIDSLPDRCREAFLPVSYTHLDVYKRQV